MTGFSIFDFRFSIGFFQHEGTKTSRHQEVQQKTAGISPGWTRMDADGREGKFSDWEIQI
jgi:hypothetical protein